MLSLSLTSLHPFFDPLPGHMEHLQSAISSLCALQQDSGQSIPDDKLYAGALNQQ